MGRPHHVKIFQNINLQVHKLSNASVKRLRVIHFDFLHLCMQRKLADQQIPENLSFFAEYLFNICYRLSGVRERKVIIVS